MVRHGGLIQSGEGGGVGRLPQFQAVSEMRCHTHSRTGVGQEASEIDQEDEDEWWRIWGGSDVPSSSEEEPEEEPESESEESEQEV